MAKTVVGLFDDYATAEAVARDLQAAGFSKDALSLAASEAAQLEHYGHYPTVQESESGAGRNAAVGAAIGSAAGFVLGLVAVAIPGIGPLVAAGPLAAALTGGVIGLAAGGLVGALTLHGIPEEEAAHYAEAVRRGATLVMVHAQNPDEVQRAVDIMNDHGAIDVAEHAEYWRATGFTTYDPGARPLTREEIAREREARRAWFATRTAREAGLEPGVVPRPPSVQGPDVVSAAGENGHVQVYHHFVVEPDPEHIDVGHGAHWHPRTKPSPEASTGAFWDSVREKERQGEAQSQGGTPEEGAPQRSEPGREPSNEGRG